MSSGHATLVTLCLALGLTSGCSHRDRDLATVREPDNASRLRIAETASAAGQTDIALSMYNAAAAATPNDPDVQARLVSMLIRAGKPDVAEYTLAAALARQPNNPTLLRWQGNLRLETGAAEAALQIFDGLIARRPNDVAALNGRGVALDLLGRHDAAQQAYLTARALQPGDLQTANNMAVSLLLMQHPSQALAVLQPFAMQSDLPSRVSNNLTIARAAAGQSNTTETGADSTIASDDLRTLAASLGAAASDSSPRNTLDPYLEAPTKPAG